VSEKGFQDPQKIITALMEKIREEGKIIDLRVKVTKKNDEYHVEIFGKTSTFYHKQKAQKIVFSVLPGTQLTNNIEVTN